jgi:DUF4097 and DUF4098 domain-containing protein YvlB
MTSVCTRSVAVAFVLWLTLPAAGGAQSTGTGAANTDQTVAVPRGARLIINSFTGDIVIHAWDKDAVRVRAQHAPRVRVSIRASESAVTVQANGAAAAGSLDYEITVPRSMPIRVDGTFGDITIDGVQSEVSVENVRGDIRVSGAPTFVTAESVEGAVSVTGARGKVKASSVNEDVRIEDATGDISAETTNGEISLLRIDSTNVDVETVNGDITYEGSVADRGHYGFATHNGNITIGMSDRANVTLTVRTFNGAFRPDLPVKSLESRRSSRATYMLGSGSAEMTLESFGGTIRLRRPGFASPTPSKR